MAEQDRDHSPSASQALAVATLVPLGGGLLALAGLLLAGSFVGLALLAPLFLLFSPVLVPAVLVPAVLLLGLAVAGFLTSGAFGLTGVAAVGNLLRQVHAMVRRAPEEVDSVRRAAEATGQLEQKSGWEAAPAFQGKAEEEKKESK